MNLSQHERQILDEIERGVEAEDPEFFARMAGSHSRHGRYVSGSVMVLFGLAAFLVAALIDQAVPAVSFFVSLTAFMILSWGLSLLGDWAFNRR